MNERTLGVGKPSRADFTSYMKFSPIKPHCNKHLVTTVMFPNLSFFEILLQVVLQKLWGRRILGAQSPVSGKESRIGLKGGVEM